MAHQNQRANLASRPFAQNLGDFGRPIQVPSDLSVYALCSELLGEVIEAGGEYTKPPAQSPERLSRRPRRAPPSHSDVFRLGRLNGTIGAHGPRRPTRSYFGLSEVRCGDRGSLWGLRR